MRDYGTNHLGLYQMLVNTCVDYLDEMCEQAVLMPPGEKLLYYYVDMWERYQTVIKRFSILTIAFISLFYFIYITTLLLFLSFFLLYSIHLSSLYN